MKLSHGSKSKTTCCSMFGAVALPKCVAVARGKCKFTCGLSSGVLKHLKRVAAAQLTIRNHLPLEHWSPDISQGVTVAQLRMKSRLLLEFWSSGAAQMYNCRTSQNSKPLVVLVLEFWRLSTPCRPCPAALDASHVAPTPMRGGGFPACCADRG